MMLETKLQELKTRLAEINDLHAANGVLTWDQTIYMPPDGAAARGRQIATLAHIAHEKFIDPAVGHLLDDLRPHEESLPYDSADASLIRIARHDYERAIRVPPQFMAQIFAHTAESYEVWSRARPDNDFAAVQPYLEKTVELSRELANFSPGYDHIADPLIDMSDYGMKAADVRTLFAELRKQQVPIVRAIVAQEAADDSCLHQFYPEDKQLSFGAEVIKRFGYDFRRGRQDKSPHPYMINFSISDVRITTRVKERNLGEGLFSSLHEAGHALYEQGVRRDFEGLPLASGTSAGVHESQSRLWENQIGRSKGFWQHFYPKLQAVFPEQLGNVSVETFYRAINKVQRSLIRTDADEVTYNLHVMMRFDFELDLLEGRLAVRDLPEVWRERFKTDMGIAPPDDRDGVLQDVHWYSGIIGGAFQGYTLGNILSAQIFDAALRVHPNLPDEIAQGEFSTLRTWLIDNIHQYGRMFTAPELIERATGSPMHIGPYINYLYTKYGELYTL
ncbi:MAG: carboxypeptidase M32 [Chloroflexales bacterium]|nr:carboxypeptidase M32 [Chloroflexales bacterium]